MRGQCHQCSKWEDLDLNTLSDTVACTLMHTLPGRWTTFYTTKLPWNSSFHIWVGINLILFLGCHPIKWSLGKFLKLQFYLIIVHFSCLPRFRKTYCKKTSFVPWKLFQTLRKSKCFHKENKMRRLVHGAHKISHNLEHKIFEAETGLFQIL